jgi:hypothetical protein
LLAEPTSAKVIENNYKRKKKVTNFEELESIHFIDKEHSQETFTSDE